MIRGSVLYPSHTDPISVFVVISTSLNPVSRSRVLAQIAHEQITARTDGNSRLIDLAEVQLPVCDADSCYGHPNVVELGQAISSAQGILIATPIYNYNVSSSAKNLVELTGKAWTDKVVGFLCAAGGRGSYMACMGLANSLMLDFRSLILPRFVYATGDAFEGNQIGDSEITSRIDSVIEQMMAISRATMPPEKVDS